MNIITCIFSGIAQQTSASSETARSDTSVFREGGCTCMVFRSTEALCRVTEADGNTYSPIYYQTILDPHSSKTHLRPRCRS